MTRPNPALLRIAEEVKTLHDQDEALSKARVKTKVEQRDVRLKIGALVTQLPADQLAFVAERSGYAQARLKDFAFVRDRWPEGSFPDDVSYTPLEELARNEDRFTLIQAGMSKRDARAARGGRVDTPSRWSPAVKAEFIKESLSDPEVARAAAGSVETRAAIARAENDIYREERDRRDRDPSYKSSRQTVSGDDIVRGITGMRYTANRLLEQAMDQGLTKSKRKEALEALAELSTSLGWLESYLNSGDTSFEQALDDLLRQEG